MYDLEISWEGLEEAFAELEAECTDIIRGMTVEIFYNTLKMSPQYFGRYVSSWTYTLNHEEFRTADDFNWSEDSQGYAMIHKKGDWGPISVAVEYNTGRDTPFKLGDRVYISNGVDHGQGPYAQGIEDGSVRLRACNQPGAPLTRSLDIATSWYGTDTSKKRADELKAMRIY